jgi:hypothetical protein
MRFVSRVGADACESSHRPPGAEAIHFQPSVLPSNPPHPQPETFCSIKSGELCWSLHLRFPHYDDPILPFYCNQCLTTMGSEGDHMTLNCHRARCGSVYQHDYFKKILGREGLRSAWITVLSRSPCLSLMATNDLIQHFANMKATSHSNPVPIKIFRSVFLSLLLVGGMPRRILDDRLHFLRRRSTTTAIRPRRPQPRRRMLRFRLFKALPALSVDQNAAPREVFSPNCRASALQPKCCCPPGISGHQPQHLV